MKPIYLLQAAPAAPTATTGTADERSTSFQPVQGGTNLQSGEKLLVEAYAAIWIILFGLILISWRRQSRLDRRIRTLEDAIADRRSAKEQ
jgi:CcmD family protein